MQLNRLLLPLLFLPVLFSLVLWLLLLSPAVAQESTDELYPSEELLEFLADFGDIDEETYELIEYHALQDTDKDQQEKSDEQ